MKSFLERNKIYFEIVASLVFGLAALLVSFASYRNSSELVTLNQRAAQPHFSVQTSYIKDEKTGTDDDTELFVSNISGFAYNIHCQVYSFIKLSLFKGGTRTDTLIPIVGYYPVSQKVGATVGTLFVFNGHANNAHYLGLVQSLKKEIMPVGLSFAESKLQNLVVIDYLDTTDTGHKAYFLDEEAIQTDEAEKELEAYKARQPLDINSASAADVMKSATH